MEGRPRWAGEAGGYLIAVVATAGMVLLRWLLDPWMGDNLPLVTLYGSVAAAVWAGGYRPAVLATILGFAACNYLFLEPRGTLSIRHSHDHIGFALYLLTCAIIAGFGEALRLARRRAQEGRELLRVTFASMGDAVITTDGEGRVTSLNAVAEALTGWTQPEAAGQPLDAVFRIVNEQTRLPAENPVTKVLAEGQVVGLANRTILIARDGTERPIDDSTAPIRDAGGVTRGAVLIFRDITERRKAEATRDRLAVIVESSDDAIIGKDLDGVITSWNRGAERLYGYAADEVVGRPVSLLLPPERPDEFPGIMERLQRGEQIDRYETVRVRKGGERVEVSVGISPVRDEAGRVIGASAIAQDVTARKRAEAVLHRAMQHIQIVTDGMSVPVTRCGRDLRYQWVNKPYADWIGRPVQEVVGRPIVDVLGEEAFEDLLPYFRRVLTGEQVRYERAVNFRGLGRRWINSTYTPTFDPAGAVDGWVAVVLDVTDRKRVEEELRRAEERVRSVVETVVDGIVTIDEGGTVETFNPAAERLFGYPATEVIGRNVKVLMPEPYHNAHDGYLANYLRTGEAKVIGIGREVVGRRKDGTTFPMELAVSEFRLGDRRYFTGVVRDITERKAAEEALQEADRRKDEFLAALAHELRNPLAPVRNALHLLQQAGNDGTAVEQARGVMERQVAQLARLVDDLLDVSRIARGKLELRRQRVELAVVVGNAVEASRPLIDQMGHELTVTLPPEPVYLDIDPVRVTQVLSNLLNNAAKYTDRGGRIGLSAERQGSDAVVAVRDTGVGIPADKLPHVFEMFTQVEGSSARAQGGLGLGLTLVKRLTEMHGGSVEARSGGPGRGSEFVVRLPVALGPGADRPPPGGETAAALPRRVLVVDDNRDGADSLAMILRLLGNEVRVAYDGAEAVRAAEAFRPDVILLDIGLPKLNGHETARRIRREPWGGRVVLIAVTGWGHEEDRRRSQEAGFDFHLVKPVDPYALMKLLAGLLPAPADTPA
jgi:PAS domain S-box-containing protein